MNQARSSEKAKKIHQEGSRSGEMPVKKRMRPLTALMQVITTMASNTKTEMLQRMGWL